MGSTNRAPARIHIAPLVPQKLADSIRNISTPGTARAALAGAVAALAYFGELWIDDRVFRYKFNDLVLLGRPFSSRPKVYLPLGLAMHLSAGAVFGVIFYHVQDLLPGPRWARGVGFALCENLSLWPILPLVDRYHPARHTGELDRLFCWKAFFVSQPRHVVFGLALAWLVPKKRKGQKYGKVIDV